MSLGGCFHAERLVRAPVVVELDPVVDHPTGVLVAFKAMTAGVLLLQRPDDLLDHAVLLWAVRRDEFLAQAAASHQAGVHSIGQRRPANQAFGLMSRKTEITKE